MNTDESSIWGLVQVDKSKCCVHSLSPEQELMKAVLFQAVMDLKQDDFVAKQARAYFLSKDVDHAFSFESVCLSFGLDVNAARKAILGTTATVTVVRRRAKFKTDKYELQAA